MLFTLSLIKTINSNIHLSFNCTLLRPTLSLWIAVRYFSSKRSSRANSALKIYRVAVWYTRQGSKISVRPAFLEISCHKTSTTHWSNCIFKPWRLKSLCSANSVSVWHDVDVLNTRTEVKVSKYRRHKRLLTDANHKCCLVDCGMCRQDYMRSWLTYSTLGTGSFKQRDYPSYSTSKWFVNRGTHQRFSLY